MENTLILKFDQASKRSLGGIQEISGFVKARQIPALIDVIDMGEYKRNLPYGNSTEIAFEIIKENPEFLPFKLKPVILSAESVQELERSRYGIELKDNAYKGIIDGNFVVFAVGLYIMKKAFAFVGKSFPQGIKCWDDFINIWNKNRSIIDSYVLGIKENGGKDIALDFYVSVKLLVPDKESSIGSMDLFSSLTDEIYRLKNSDVSHSLGPNPMHIAVKKIVEEINKPLAERVAWSSDDEGNISFRDLSVLACIPLSKISPVRDEEDTLIEEFKIHTICSSKLSASRYFDQIMESRDVTKTSDGVEKTCEIINSEVVSAIKMAAQLSELFDYLCVAVPETCKKLGIELPDRIPARYKTEEEIEKKTPFFENKVEVLVSESTIWPLITALSLLVSQKEESGKRILYWSIDPREFLDANMDKIVSRYCGVLSLCSYIPSKFGRSAESFNQILDIYKMALAGI